LEFELHQDLSNLIGDREVVCRSFGASGMDATIFLRESARASILNVREDSHWFVDLLQVGDPWGVCALGDSFVLASVPDACLYSGTGELLRRFRIGDHLAHAQADPNSRLWVTYSDQGARQEIAQRGLSCFDAHGQTVAPWWSCWMLDCYAMNAAKDGIWFCGMIDFEVKRLGYDGKMSAWSNAVCPTAIAGWSKSAALYREDSITFLDLTGRKAIVREQLRAHAPAGSWRGLYFHALHESIWYRLERRRGGQ